MATDITPARRALDHRIRTHHAALRLASQLGHPSLRRSVLVTLIRLDEAKRCRDAVTEREAS